MTIKDKIRETFKGKEEQTFKPHEIIDLVMQKCPDTNPTSILPADRCYNRINKGIERNFTFHVFDLSDDSTYKYLGEGYNYSGPIYWKGKVVGEWVNGKKVKLQQLK
jgi:hypothetical protein